MSRKPQRKHLPLILVAGLFLAACGNSSSTSTGSFKHPSSHKTTTTKQESVSTSIESGKTSSTTSTSLVSQAAACVVNSLRLAEDQSLSVVSAGSTELAIVVTNVGNSPCSLDGYPSVAFFPPQGGLTKANDQAIKLKITDASTAYKQVSIPAGSKAVFYIKYFSVPVDGVGCSVIGSLSVGFPNTAGKVNLNIGFSGCGPGVVLYPVALLS
ncbi:MAG: DUF4232 domain-containing protein [Firmicutes bacterium]|nr:DUF4232 domain-containing protein [Bacillota bacterium]